MTDILLFRDDDVLVGFFLVGGDDFLVFRLDFLVGDDDFLFFCWSFWSRMMIFWLEITFFGRK